ncbi:MAG: PH domain-containing protein [Desulfotomaculaceae bacterium]|nr:PH domain-containing protein [Desulfotomaculaceae bacterium]
MEIQEDIIFETKHSPYSENLKRILITSISLNLIFLIVFRWSWTRAVTIFLLFALMDLITFYLPAISKKYIITSRHLIIKSWFGSKEIPFSRIGSISAAKSKILLVSTSGRVLLKIQEIFLHPSVREEFKDLLFEQIQKD